MVFNYTIRYEATVNLLTYEYSILRCSGNKRNSIL